MTIQAFFNPQKEGDTFSGLNGSIEGRTNDHIEQNLHRFLEQAGRDYDVLVRPAMVGLGDGQTAQVPEQFFLTRSSDNLVISDKTVTRSYGPLSLKDIAVELQPFCDQGWATPDGVYDRSGSLEIVSLRLDAGGDLPNGETFKHYIIVENPHGGGGKVKGKIIDWRIVCANTFAMAVAATHDFVVTHRIPRDTEDPNDLMKQRIAFAVEQWENVQDHIRKLADRIDVFSGFAMDEAAALAATDKLLSIDGKAEDAISTRSKNKRDAIMAGFNKREAGTDGDSLWDWYNGVTYFLSSPSAEINVKSKVDPLDRLVRNVNPDGSGAKVEERAMDIALDLIGA
jgi:hypothetical protein